MHFFKNPNLAVNIFFKLLRGAHWPKLFPSLVIADSWQLTDDSWQLTADRWQRTADSWQLIADSWQLMADNWQRTVDSWQVVTSDRCPLTGDMWQVTGDRWQVITGNVTCILYWGYQPQMLKYSVSHLHIFSYNEIILKHYLNSFIL